MDAWNISPKIRGFHISGTNDDNNLNLWKTKFFPSTWTMSNLKAAFAAHQQTQNLGFIGLFATKMLKDKVLFLFQFQFSALTYIIVIIKWHKLMSDWCILRNMEFVVHCFEENTTVSVISGEEEEETRNKDKENVQMRKFQGMKSTLFQEPGSQHL